MIKSLSSRSSGKAAESAADADSTPTGEEPREAANQSGNEDGAGKKRRRRRSKGGNTGNESWSLDQFVVEEQEGETRFHDLGLRDELMRGIHALGFQYCSPIQAGVLPQTLQGHDAIGKAQTGTGKTAAFLITIFNDML